MPLSVAGTAIVQNAETNDLHCIEAENLFWALHIVDLGDEGREIIHFTQLEHPVLGSLKWAIWKNPEGVLDDVQTDVGAHRLLLNFEIALD